MNGIILASYEMEESMINQIKDGVNQIKEEIYAKATAVIGIAAVMGLAFMLGVQQKANHRR
jgi:hypothetical protein